jgi:two-component system chemotaxis response regulator CheY
MNRWGVVIWGACKVVVGQLRALVVDDNAHARAICLMSLGRLGIAQVEEAANGAEAILKLMQVPFSLVLMDWYMPDISGAGVLQVLRDPRFGAAATTPVILMTAYPSEDNLARARALGVTHILPKPFSTAHLGAALERVLVPHRQGEAVFV